MPCDGFCIAFGLIACRVHLPLRSLHPLAAILLTHNDLLLVGWKNYQGAGTMREGENAGRKKWKISRKPSIAAPQNQVTAVMICRLSSHFRSILFHFLISPLCSNPRAQGGFYLSNEPLTFQLYCLIPFCAQGKIHHFVNNSLFASCFEHRSGEVFTVLWL